MAEASIAPLETRIQELEDVREIQDLFFKWHYSNTGGFNGKPAGRLDFLECLTDDGTIEIESQHAPGKGPRGREEYTQYTGYYEGDDGPLPYVFQTSVADKVEINGDTAVHTSVQLGIFQFRVRDASTGRGELGNPRFTLSYRVNDCVRTSEGWRITKSTNQPPLSIPVDELHGNLNELPEVMANRTPWAHKG